MEHFYILRSGSGRPTDERQERPIVRAAVAARTGSREEIREHVASAVSAKIIGNRLLTTGLRSRVPLARLPFIPRHRQARLLRCRERVDWRVEWCSVVSSDESRFCLYASDGRIRVRRRPSQRHLPKCIRPRHRPHLRFHGVGIYNSR